MARRRRSKVQRVVNVIRKFLAFLFSNVGLFAIVVGYALLGSVTFRAIESPHELNIQRMVHGSRSKSVSYLWNTTYKLNVLNELQWKIQVKRQVLEFKGTVMKGVRAGYDGKELGVSAQWTFTGAFLYSLTVITTIGYGNIACKTYFGKTVTIMYAIVGIPLMLLFLTNTGDVLAKSFKFLYSYSLRLKMKLVIWHRKRKAARHRRAMNAEAGSVVSSRSRSSARSAHRLPPPPPPPPKPNHSAASFRRQLSQDSFPVGGGDIDELLSARAELEQLSLKESMEERLSRVTVPLSLVLLTMIGYLVSGSVLFCIWEGWGFLDAFYFCYVSLTTIGFGDLFPGSSVKDDGDAGEKLVICSLYLLLGMALIAMCFNLAQEEVVNKVTNMATKLGMIKPDSDQYD